MLVCTTETMITIIRKTIIKIIITIITTSW